MFGKKKKYVLKCDDCGKIFFAGNRPDGLPNGIGFQLEDGTIYTACCECIIKKGIEVERGKK